MEGRRAHRQHRRLGRRGRLAFSCGALFGLVLGSCSPRQTQANLEKRLAATIGTHRIVRPRLTGAFGYALCGEQEDSSLVVDLRCGPTEATEAAREALMRLAHDIVRFASDAPGPESARLQAQWTLLTATEPTDYRRAVRELELAAGRSPDRADLWSDLSSARLVLADATDDPRLLMAAAAAAERALRLDNSLATARFNRALAFDHFHLRGLATEAWRQFLAVEWTTEWAEEARARLQLLSVTSVDWARDRDELLEGLRTDPDGGRRLRDSYPSEAEAYAVESVLTSWAETSLADDSARSAEAWSLANRIVAALEGGGATSLVGEAVRAIEEAPPAEVRLHAAALRDLGHGIAIVEHLPGDALSDFSAAKMALSQVGSPLAIVADSRLNQAAWLLGHYQQVEQRAADILARVPEVTRHPWIAQSWRWRAQVAGFAGRFSDARVASERVLSTASPTDHALRARTYADLADLAIRLRGPADAWVPIHQALAAQRSVARPRSARTIYGRLATLLTNDRHYAIALKVMDEAVSVARSLSPNELAGSLRRRAELNAALERFEQAKSDANEALELIAGFPSEERRIAQTQDTRLLLGEIAARESPREALPTLSSVISEFQENGYSYPLARAYVTLAQAHALLGDAERADSVLLQAVSVVESQRENLTRNERAGFQDLARPVVEQLVTIRSEAGRHAEAFDLFEGMRSRVLLEDLKTADWLTGSESLVEPLTSRRVSEGLPEGTTLVSYAVLDDRSYVWVLTKDTLRSSRLEVSAQRLRQMSASFRDVVMISDESQAEALGAELYDLLVRPLALTSGSRLIIVPDRSLHYLPFVALYNARRSRYLVEEHEIIVAPSASINAFAKGRASTLGLAKPRVLAVGDPAFPKDRYALGELPFARVEAMGVAAVWRGNGVLLVGAAATRAAFLEHAADATIVHFAGHAVVRPDSPDESYLLMAPDDGWESAQLRSIDLVALRFPATELVILSACQTADGRLSDTEGVMSLAGSFLAAGVPGLIPSLWAVPDAPTSVFFKLFHEGLAAIDGNAPAVLQATQVEAASPDSGIPMATWAAFQFIGGSSRP